MSEKANMAARHEHEIPEGYEARIDGNKVIIELKESEDEKFARIVLDLPFKHEADYKFVRAYLERQKKQQTLILDGEIEDKKRDIVAAIRKYYPADYAEYLTSFLKGLSPEDNSEDEYGQEMLGIAYKLMYEHIPENLRTQEFWDSLKFMREYTGKVAIIHSYEKPAEWSEEDEKMLHKVITIIERNTIGNHNTIDWLKCLPERFKTHPHWKPSEEQVSILGKVFAGCKLNTSERDSMVDLFYHLKDMKGYD